MPLIEHYPLVYLPNALLARTLARRSTAQSRPTARLVMGPPDTDLIHSWNQAADLAEQWSVLDEQGTYPHALDGMRIDVLRAQARHVAVAHLTTHSTFDFSDYLQSAILFYQERLTLFRLISDPTLDFTGMRLFFLDSCESGLTRPDPGDELQGLVWALTYAGAESVLATLWPVDDYAAQQMTRIFYESWQGATPSPLPTSRPFARCAPAFRIPSTGHLTFCSAMASCRRRRLPHAPANPSSQRSSFPTQK